MEDYKKALLAGAALLGATTSMFDSADAAGYYGSGWPTPSVSNNTLPLTGNETAVWDTNLGQGLQPQSELLSTGALSNYIQGQQVGGGMRNALIGGDFATNLWQRGTTNVGGNISSTLTYTADRWFAVATTAGTINVNRETTSLPTRVGASLRFQRQSGDTNLNLLTLGQVITTANSWRFPGRTAVLSFNVKAGASFITAPSSFNAIIATGTGTDQSAANMVAGTWTAQVNNSASITPASTAARFSMAVPIPTAGTQVGVMFQYTPTTATAGANEWIELSDVQLEVSIQSASWAAAANYSVGETVVSNGNLFTETATTCVSGANTAPTGQTNGQIDNTCTWNFVSANVVPVQPTAFDKRLAPVEANLQYPYFFRVNEPTAGAPVALCQATSSTQAFCNVLYPEPLRAAPSAITITTGNFSNENSNGAVLGGCTVTSLLTLSTANNGALKDTCTTSSFIGGQATMMVGSSGVGTIDFFSEL